MEKKVRMKVLQPFNRNLDGQMVSGHPEHPHGEDGQFVHVSEESAVKLENEGLAKRMSHAQQAKADAAAAKGEGNDAGADGRKSAQQVREEKVKATAAPKAGRKPAGNLRRGGGKAAGSPESAAVNHPAKNIDGSDSKIPGGQQEKPDPDAAP